MRTVLPALLSLLLPCAATSAETVDERVLRAGDTELRVAVVEVEDRARADLLHRLGRGGGARDADRVRALPARLGARARLPAREPQHRGGAVGPDLAPRRGLGAAVRAPDATLEELRADWTAVHEFSHLYHPYLGDDGRWLAEGLASYYQNVLRARAGLLAPEEAWRRLEGGFARGRRATGDVALAELGRGRGATMRIYWAGAAYWLDADLALRGRGTTLDAVLDRHARCCLRGTASMTAASFVAALDEAGGDGVFARLYEAYSAARSFPSQDAAYAALGIAADGGTLRFSRAPQAARLRAAIMRPKAQGSGAD